MHRQALHEMLENRLGLIPESIDNHLSRTYFHQRIEWHPARSTRVLRVMFNSHGEPSRIQLCASSDNNNAVLIAAPFTEATLVALTLKEIERVNSRNAHRSACPCVCP